MPNPTALTGATGYRSTTNADVHTTAPFDIPSACLLVAVVHGRGTITTDPTVTDSGPGLTWSLPPPDPSAIGARYIGHFVAKATAPATGVTLTVTFLTADTPNGCAIDVIAVPDADISGTADAAVVQNYAAEWSSSTSHSMTFTNPTSASSVILASSQIATEQTMTAPGDFTELAQGGFPTPSTTAQTIWKTGHTDAFVQGASWVSGSNGGFTVLEISTAAGPTVVTGSFLGDSVLLKTVASTATADAELAAAAAQQGQSVLLLGGL